MVVKWPAEMYFAQRILTHSRFHGHYNKNHPKWIALQKVIDEGMGEGTMLKSTMIIPLPGSGFEFADPGHIGHENVTIINNTHPETRAKTSIFCIINLWKQNKGQQFSQREMMDDDFECD